MPLRAVLRGPGGDPVVRDVDSGRWVEPSGPAELTIGDGLWALPGLVDGHAHFAAAPGDGWGEGGALGVRRRAEEALAAGVLLALDKGASDLSVVDMIESVSPSERPEIETAGIILRVEDGYWTGFGRIVGPGRIGPEVDRAATESKGWVKLVGDWPRKGLGPVANFTESELAEAVAVAGRHGARVAIHTMAREVPAMAVRAGVQSIEHGLFLDPEDIAALGDRGGIWVPTVLRMEAVVEQLGVDSSGGRLLTEGLANVARLLMPAVEAGVHVLTGTDLAVGSQDLAAEAVRLWEMGMSAEAVVDSISGAGYRATSRPDWFPIGAPADAVLFAESPVDDPRVLAHARHVIRLGRLLQ